MHPSCLRRAAALSVGMLTLLCLGPVNAAPGWTYLGPHRATVTSLAISPTDPDRILAVVGHRWEYPVADSFWGSDDAGLTWARPPDAHQEVHDVVFDDQGRGLAASFSGLLEHAVGSPGWVVRAYPFGQPGAISTHKVAVAPGPSPAVWALGTKRNLPFDDSQVFRITAFNSPWPNVRPAAPVGYRFEGLAVSRSAPGSVAVTAAGSPGDPLRLWVTQDDGASWQDRSSGLPPAVVHELRWEGERLYLAFGAQDGGASGLLVSHDLGVSWTQIHGGPTAQTPAYDVVADPANPNRLWVATAQGIHRSVDGGQTWAHGIGGSSGLPIRQLRFDAGTGRLWAGLFDHGVWVSNDGGDSFHARDHGLNPLPSVSIAISPANVADVAVAHQGGVVGHVSTSRDGGLSWDGPDHPDSLSVSRVRYDSQGRLYATLTGNSLRTLYRRDAPGAWTHVGLPSPPTGNMRIDDMNFGDNDDTLLMSIRTFHQASSQWIGRLWRSADAGQTWGVVLDALPGTLGLSQVERIPTPLGTRLFVYEHNTETGDSGRVLASDDNGLTWSNLTAGLPNFIRGAMCVGEDGQVSLVVEEDFEPRIYRSFDHGDTWTRTAWEPVDRWTMGVATNVLHCPGDGQRMLIGGYSGQLWMSTDGGNSFDALVASADTWGENWVQDIQSSAVGTYVVHRGGVWAITDLDPPAPSPSGLQVSTVNSHMRVRATLAWSEGAAQVDIRRGGVRVATVANTGSYRDTVPSFLAPPGTTWQVCNAGTEDCSDAVGVQVRSDVPVAQPPARTGNISGNISGLRSR